MEILVLIAKVFLGIFLVDAVITIIIAYAWYRSTKRVDEVDEEEQQLAAEWREVYRDFIN